MINLNRFFNPKSIAIIGASRNPDKVGNVILRNLVKSKFDGKLFPVNPKTDSILNLKCYKSVTNIKENIDLAVIAIPAKLVLNIAKECNKRSIKNILIITSGFKEDGNEKLEKELKEFLIKNKISTIGVNCLGVLDLYSNLDTIFLPRNRLERPKKGKISLVCQSGAVGAAILDLASSKGHKFSKFISYGNATVIDESDLIEYLSKDRNTKVICAYIEGVQNGTKFFNTLKKVSKIKPIIILKAGTTEQGNKATLSHTGSLAGSPKVYEGIFKQTNTIIANTLEDMFDFVSLFEKNIRPRGSRVQIITNGGGYGVISTDAIVKSKLLQLAVPSTKKLIKNIPIKNPIDLLGDATDDLYEKAISLANKDKNIDILLTIVVYQTPLLTDKLTKIFKRSKKPIIVVSTGGSFVKKLKKDLESENIPTYTFPENAIKALDVLINYYKK